MARNPAIPSISLNIKQEIHYGIRKTYQRRSPPRSLLPDILLAKLRPGQRIEVEMFVEKGIASLDSVQVGSLSLLHLCGMLPDCGPEVSLQGTRSCTSMHPVQL